MQLRTVEETFRTSAATLSLTAGGKSVVTTIKHPFYVENKGWVRAEELLPGDLLVGKDQELTPVESILATGRTETVYNMRVADAHTYFVGNDDWGFSLWVHNSYKVREVDGPNGGKIYEIYDTETGEVIASGGVFDDPVKANNRMIELNENLNRPPRGLFGETFESFEAAAGVDDIYNGFMLETKEAKYRSEGFTEKWIGQKPNGDWVTSFYNPDTGKWSGAKGSSHNPNY